jgi:fatty-acyl-CoA synthase
VVRKADPRWGEVPVAVVARNDDRLSAEDLYAACRRQLAGFKQPKDIRFVAFADLPRSTTGKIQRHEVEAWFRTDS